MSYCRWGPKSNVYIYAGSSRSGKDAYVCACGDFDHQFDYVVASAVRMFAHMIRHIKRGDKVPLYALLSMASDANTEYELTWTAMPEDVRAAKRKQLIERSLKRLLLHLQ